MNPDSEKQTDNLLFAATIAHPTDLPQAMVLAQSFQRFHPDSKFFILLLGKAGKEAVNSGIEIFGLGGLELAAGEEWRLPMLHTATELSNILQPVLFQTLLRKGGSTIAYFECSALLYAPLSSGELPDEDNAIVTTAATPPTFGDSGRSFIAVRAGADTSLQTWANAIHDFPSHRVIKSSTFGVAYWNLDPESLTVSPHGYEVAEQPLRMFDFRGYNPAKPHLLSRLQGFEPRILLSKYPVIAALCDEYRDRLIDATSTVTTFNCRGFDVLPNGLRIDARMLKTYRDALTLFHGGKGPEPPSPFGPSGEEGFLTWLNEPIDKTQGKVTRYMLAVHEEREDIKAAFPDPLGVDAAAFRNWYLLYGQHELDLPAAVVPQRPSVNEIVNKPAAVNVAGYFRAELGLGVAARSLLSALDAAAIPYNTISFDATANRQNHPFADRKANADNADINILCVNPDQLPAFAEQSGAELRHGRYTIGVWFWEVEDFPRAFHNAFNYVDEIWVASEFMRETFLKVSPKPVFKFRLPVLTPQVDPSLSRQDFGLPKNFVFLFNFDLLSVLERKNPLGLIEAFTRAFKLGEGPVLVIKTINGDQRLLELEKLRYAVRERPDIIVRDGYLSAAQQSTLTAFADCYASLHRSEGFGLTIAEAMALGKPVIATAYSGNLEFMTAENSYLCPSTRSGVGCEREPYPPDSIWSEPDIEAAAELLRQVYNYPDEARARGSRAADDLRRRHSPQAAAPIIQDRFATIRRHRSSPLIRSAAFYEDVLDDLKNRGRGTHA